MSEVRKSAFNYECVPLDWDSKYFGISCGRVNLYGPVNEAEQKSIMDFCRRFEFVTLANIRNHNENNLWIGRCSNAFLADINIQFYRLGLSAHDDNVLSEADTVAIYNKFGGNEKVLDMAERAFGYSRFFNDPFLTADLAQKIYRQWSVEAFGREDKYFAIYYKGNEIAGYVLFNLNIEAGYATIELIAVDEKFRGRGIGKAMLAAVERYIAGMGFTGLRVGTQAGNHAAISLYLGYGFKFDYCSSIYHLWNKAQT